MKKFQYINAASRKDVISNLKEDYNQAMVLAGGLDVIGELKNHLVEPETVINLGGLDDLNYIKMDGDALRIGAMATIADIAANGTIRTHFTGLSDAASVVGSPQIRNVGTMGGNLCQRPRCWYYREEEYPCLKKGGHVCYSVSGRNKYNAILGGGPSYIVHPSDCAPPLITLDANLHLLGPEGERTLPIEEFFILPSEGNLTRENVLKPNEIITEVEIPKTNMKSRYIKFREKESYDWALSAAAVAMDLDGERCRKARIVLGGVAPKPWRVKNAEAILEGESVTEELAGKAAEAALEGAQPLEDNAFKVPLTQAIVKDAIMDLVA